MTLQELRNFIVEHAALLRTHSVNSAHRAIQLTARLLTEERLGQVFERVESFAHVPGSTHDEHITQQHLHHTAKKALVALKVAIAFHNHGRSDPTIYDDINHIILTQEGQVRDQHHDLLCLIVETLQPVRKKFYSAAELVPSIGRVCHEALNSITKFCLPDSDHTDIKNINRHLEAFFDSIPLILATGEQVIWIKILIAHTNRALNSTTTSEDVQSLSQCLFLLTNVRRVLHIKHNITVSVGTDTLETSERYASTLLLTATVESETALRKHEQCYPGLLEKIEHILELGERIERLKFYTGDALLFFRGTQKYLVTLIHRFLVGTSVGQYQQPTSSSTLLSSSESAALLSAMVEPFSYIQLSNTSGTSLPVSFSISRMLYPAIPGPQAMSLDEMPSAVVEFQDELRSVLATVHYLDNLILMDFGKLLERHRNTSLDHNCLRCSHILEANTSYHVMEYIKLAVGALQRTTAHRLRHEECVIYVSSALLANALAQGAVYKNLPEPVYHHQDVYRTQAQFSQYIPRTKEDFLNYGVRLDQELMSCIFEIPINNAVGEHIASQHTYISHPTAENTQTSIAPENRYTRSSSLVQPVTIQPGEAAHSTTLSPLPVLNIAQSSYPASDNHTHYRIDQRVHTQQSHGVIHHVQRTGSEHRLCDGSIAQDVPLTFQGGATYTISSSCGIGQLRQGASLAARGLYNVDTVANTNEFGMAGGMPSHNTTQHVTSHTATEHTSTSVAEPESTTWGTGSAIYSHCETGKPGQGEPIAHAERNNVYISLSASEWNALAGSQGENIALLDLDTYTIEHPSASVTEPGRTAIIMDPPIAYSYEIGNNVQAVPRAVGRNNEILDDSEQEITAKPSENTILQGHNTNNPAKLLSVRHTRLSARNVEEHFAQHENSSLLFDACSASLSPVLIIDEARYTERTQTYSGTGETQSQEGAPRVAENECNNNANTIKITEQQSQRDVGTNCSQEPGTSLNRVDAALAAEHNIVGAPEDKRRYQLCDVELPASSPLLLDFESAFAATASVRARYATLLQRTDSSYTEPTCMRETESQKPPACTVHPGKDIEENSSRNLSSGPVQESRMPSRPLASTNNAAHIPPGGSLLKRLPSTVSAAIHSTLGEIATEATVGVPSVASVSDRSAQEGATACETMASGRPGRGKATHTASSGGKKREGANVAHRNSKKPCNTAQDVPASVAELPAACTSKSGTPTSSGRKSGAHLRDSVIATRSSHGANHTPCITTPKKRHSAAPTVAVLGSPPQPTFNTHPELLTHNKLVEPSVPAAAQSVSSRPASSVWQQETSTVINPSSVTAMACRKSLQSGHLGNN